MPLVPILPPDYDVELSLAYATADNFTGAPVYRRANAYLHPDAAVCLRRAIALAAPQGLRLRLFDAFRPSEAQWALWTHTPDPDFIADPRRGSPHSRGVAVDLTLTDAAGRDLDMGTAFDAFTPLSHHANMEIAPQAQRNRYMLLGIMISAGWHYYGHEWWHYQLPQAPQYPLFSDSCLKVPMMGPR